MQLLIQKIFYLTKGLQQKIVKTDYQKLHNSLIGLRIG